jgi:glycosyltransferase involved in cell wall biosynthesis
MNPIRVALLADFLEEGWPSMDLVADMLLDRLEREHAGRVKATLVRPKLKRRLSRLSPRGRVPGLDRVAGRMWDYPRTARALGTDFDIFHIVDHSYAQLVHDLPGSSTVVTCHDVDTFRSVIEPDREPRGPAFRAMTRRILGGLRKAGHVVCDTEATREQLIQKAGIVEEKTSVVHNGPHPDCTPDPETSADREAARLLGPPRSSVDVLHVGSAIPRKRIDLLIRIMAALDRPVRLVRVGGAFAAEQAALARDLGVSNVVVLPFVDRSTLAAIYRRSALVVMPSEREGFGLPVIEALSCGTPVVASDIPALKEVGGEAVSYCEVGDIEGWSRAIGALLDERDRRPADWIRRRELGIRRAEAFSWSKYAAEIVALYARMSGHRSIRINTEDVRPC